MSGSNPIPIYEAPRVTELGSVHGLTQVQDKKFGESDGFTFMGVAITNASPYRAEVGPAPPARGGSHLGSRPLAATTSRPVPRRTMRQRDACGRRRRMTLR
jgi:hypothetical protein